MSSRIVRGDDHRKKSRVSADAGSPVVEVLGRDHAMSVEKDAYEKGYAEGERIGKQMGDRMVAAAVQRYDRAVQEIAALHQTMRATMETEAVRLSLAVARRIVQREVTMEPDLVAALVTVALKRLQGHMGVTARVSSHDFARLEEAIHAVNTSLVVREDPSLDRGDFMLDSAQTHVDGRIASQIDSIGRALLDG